MKNTLKLTALLSCVFLLCSCTQEKPSKDVLVAIDYKEFLTTIDYEEVLTVINYIEENGILPRPILSNKALLKNLTINGFML